MVGYLKSAKSTLNIWNPFEATKELTRRGHNGRGRQEVEGGGEENGRGVRDGLCGSDILLGEKLSLIRIQLDEPLIIFPQVVIDFGLSISDLLLDDG